MSASAVRYTPPHPSLPAHVRVVGSVVGRRTVLSVSGEIDVASAPLLAEAVDNALHDGALELWIDLTRTDFMDSSGLHALLAARNRVDELNRRLAVICPGGPVRRLFDIAGVAGRLPLYADRAAAHHSA
jgi:anti-sigma B factor antagonist